MRHCLEASANNQTLDTVEGFKRAVRLIPAGSPAGILTFKIRCKYTEPGANLPASAPVAAATVGPATGAQPRAGASAATTPASQVARN